MAEINKLSIGQVLDKLRRADAASTKPCLTQLEIKTDELDKEARRLRAERVRIEQASAKPSRTAN